MQRRHRRHRRHWVPVRRRRRWRSMQRRPGQQWWGRSCPCPMAIPIAQKLTDFANRSNARLWLEDDPREARIRQQVRPSRRLPIRRYARTLHGSVHTRSVSADDLRVLQSRISGHVAGQSPTKRGFPFTFERHRSINAHHMTGRATKEQSSRSDAEFCCARDR